MILYGIRDNFTSNTTAFVQAFPYQYRRADDFLCAFSSPITNVTATTGVTTATETTTSEGGTTSVTHITSINSATYSAGFGHYALLSDNIAFNDPRVSFTLSGGLPASGGTSPSVATFRPEIPTHRYEGGNNLGLYIANSGTSWAFKQPLPLVFAFAFDAANYTVSGRIPATYTNAPGKPDLPAEAGDHSNGRMVHSTTPLYNYDIEIPAVCAVHGTTFTTLAQEVAHNSLSFQLVGGAQSKTFNNTLSTLTLPSTSSPTTLNCRTESEAAPGLLTSRIYFPAIVRVAASITEEGAVHIDVSSSISPTTAVTGARLAGALTSVDHFNVGGSTYSPTDPTIYIPATSFDIVLKEGVTGPISFTIHVTVDCSVLPTGSDDTLTLNWQMSIPASLSVTVVPTSDENMLITYRGEYVRRDKSHVWQHKGLGPVWAGELTTGNVYKSTNKGATWVLMANAWTGVSGATPKGFTSLPFGAAISIANVGGTLQSRYSADGTTWQPPVSICPFTAGKWAIASREYAGSSGIEVRNNSGTEHFISTNRGRTWQGVTS